MVLITSLRMSCSLGPRAPGMCRGSSKHRSSVRRAVLRLQQHSKKRILITTMATSSIHALIQSKRYSPELIGDLEKHLQGQFDQKTYDFEANLALLKLYQFHPHKSDKAAIAKVLIKALMQMPSTDFLLCSYQVPERIVSLRVRNMFVVAIHHHAADVFLLHNKQADASLAKLFKLAGLLESGKFKDFWAEANESRDVLSVAPEFDESIRKCMYNFVWLFMFVGCDLVCND